MDLSIAKSLEEAKRTVRSVNAQSPGLYDEHRRNLTNEANCELHHQETNAESTVQNLNSNCDINTQKCPAVTTTMKLLVEADYIFLRGFVIATMLTKPPSPGCRVSWKN